MPLHHIYDYNDLDEYRFEKLPKGNMLEISMNPYNGHVLLKFDKHDSSYEISLDIMRDIVHACDVLERMGSDKPLDDYVWLCEIGAISDVLTEAARQEIKRYEGRRSAIRLVPLSEVMVKAS